MDRRGFLAVAGALGATAGLGLPDAVASGAGRPAPEDGYDLWLRYRLVEPAALRSAYRARLAHLVVDQTGATLLAARDELVRGLGGLLGAPPEQTAAPRSTGTVLIGTGDSALIRALVSPADLAAVGDEGYVLRTVSGPGRECIVIASAGEAGVLHGAFHLLRLVQTHADLASLDLRERPANRLRMVNHWDNLNRTVERGYAGRSIFDWDALPQLSSRYTDYARALASLGLNATAINNVNASSTFLSTAFIPKLVALAGLFRTYGITLFVSANFASPQNLGGLPTSDPLDPRVQQWWNDKAAEIYAAIPDFGGFLVKASSEGQPGPITYGRTHAEGANTLAAAVAPYGGIVIYRAFVHGGPDTWTEDAWNEFTPLDGDFAGNAVVQIKNGPMDFNVREPVHPLFGGLPRTSSMIELQITQEYTGHSTHLCYLVPQWKQVLDFDTRRDGRGPLVREIVTGCAGVINFGDDRNWTGHHLAAANTHGYGRLAWDPALPARSLAEEWVMMTFGTDRLVTERIADLLMSSWETYEDYVAVLGQGYLMHGLGDHFGPDLPATVGWHRADRDGVGFDRSVATGSGFAGFYAPPIAARYERPETTPEELLLFFHHLPYDHRLVSGPTVIQRIYDDHFTGAERAARLHAGWRSLRGLIDPQRYAEVDARFARQVEQAIIWRDAVVGYFFELSRILDDRRSWLQVTPAPDAILLGGRPNRFPIGVGNASPRAAAGRIALTVPAGWSSESTAFTVAPREFTDVTVAVVPPLEPAVAEIAVDVTAPLELVGATRRQVVTAPTAGRCVYALDAGTATSPLLTGYSRLAPATSWSPGRGYGWSGGTPQSRDRGVLDPLRRDFCNDTAARTLRLAIPAGASRLHLLIGDATVQARGTTVVVDGVEVADSGPLDPAEFRWLHADLDGGSAGRTIDVRLSGRPGEHWHLAALALIDPGAPARPAAIGDVVVTTPLTGGRDNTLVVPVTSLSTDSVEVTLSLTGPAGWHSTPVTVSVAAGETAHAEVTVRPPLAPQNAQLTITATSPAGEPANASTALEVIAVPAAGDTTFALDAGPVGSPLLTGYTALTPASTWREDTAFGWLSGTILDRDRDRLDVLRRDLVLGRDPAVLRLRLPAGSHRGYLLTGDAFAPGARTTVSIGGSIVADSGPAPIPQGSFRWIDWPMSGGDVDLTLTGSEGDGYWRLVCMVVAPAP